MKGLRNCFVLSIIALALVSLTFAEDEEPKKKGNKPE